MLHIPVFHPGGGGGIITSFRRGANHPSDKINNKIHAYGNFVFILFIPELFSKAITATVMEYSITRCLLNNEPEGV
jgi:hypothetical protein